MATAAHTVVYVPCPGSGEIAVLGFDPETGAIEDRDRVAAGHRVMPVAVSPDRRHLYAALRDEPQQVASYRIDPAGGGLTEIGRFDVAGSMPHISVDRTGNYLLGAAFNQGHIRVHPIGARGVAQGQPVMVEHNIPAAHCILTDPANRFVLIPARDADVVLQRRFDPATGMLTPNDPPAYRSAHGSGPRHLIFHPNNRFAYVVNEIGGSVDACGYDMATGKLSLIHTETLIPDDYVGEAWAAEIDITPDARFLYASERNSRTISGFAVNPESGFMSLIGRWPTEVWPRGFRIDQRGRHLLAVGEESGSLTVHRIDQETGTLSEVSRHPIGAGSCWVEVVDLP